MKNEFLTDAPLFLRAASEVIADGVEDKNMPFAALNAALGVERVLKAVLFSINPLYVYKQPEFNHSLQVVYPDRIVATNPKVLEKNPSGEVLSFRAALHLCSTVSQTARTHSSLLFRIAHQRDIVAHCVLSALDNTACQLLLERDFYPLVEAFSGEMGVPAGNLIGPRVMALKKIALRHEGDIAKKAQGLLELHRDKWRQLSGKPGYAKEMQAKTLMELKQKQKESDCDSIIASCPACDNDAVIRLEPDYECAGSESILVGLFATAIGCRYCKLQIVDYDILDFLSIQEKALAAMQSDMALDSEDHA